jgi:hypothetical protein
MGLAPGRYYAGSPIRIGVHFEEDDGDDVDPATVTFVWKAPCGSETTYVYGTDVEIVKINTGDYYAEVTPTEGGRWRYAWMTTGANKTIRFWDQVLVQDDPFDGYAGVWGSDYA